MKINNKIKQLITFIVSVCLLVGFDQFTKHLADLKLNYIQELNTPDTQDKKE